MVGCVGFESPIALESDGDYISFADVERRFKSMYPSYNPYQKEALEAITKAFNDGYKVVVLKAPVAFGKSAVGYSMCVNDAFYVVHLKLLQDQLKRDFGKDSRFSCIKGRGAYKCIVNENKCDCGQCKLDETKFNNKKCGNSSLEMDKEESELLDERKIYCRRCEHFKALIPLDQCTSCRDKCKYFIAQEKASDSHVCLMNVNYFLNSQYIRDGRREVFPNRNLLIIDEAHCVPSKILDYVSVTFNILDILNLIDDIEASKNYTIHQLPLEDAVKWLRNDVYQLVQVNILKLSQIKTRSLTQKEGKLKNKLEDIEKKMDFFFKDYSNKPDAWVVDYVKSKKKEYEGKISKISFQPIYPTQYIREFLWSRADRVLLMTATFEHEIDMDEFGLDNEECKIIEYPTTIPMEQRPIIYDPQGKMSKYHKAQTIEKVAEKIARIIRIHENENGLVHCHTHENAAKIYDLLMKSNLSNKLKERIQLQIKNDRELSLNTFLSRGGVLLSVKMTEGLDLKDTFCRYSILACVPFAYFGDARIQKRINTKGGKQWYDWQAIRDIGQAYGRAVRHKNDYAKFYILDSCMDGLYPRYKRYFPMWFNDYIDFKGGLEKCKYIFSKNSPKYGGYNGTLQSL